MPARLVKWSKGGHRRNAGVFLFVAALASGRNDQVIADVRSNLLDGEALVAPGERTGLLVGQRPQDAEFLRGKTQVEGLDPGAESGGQRVLVLTL